jgi:UTP--glucose-1-phosphate uridylyltransferase
MENVSSYGIIEGDKITDDLYQVTRMVEKPDPENAPSTMGIIGRYILTPEIFDILRDTPPGKNGELQVTDALNTLAEQGKVLAYRFKGRRFDCGSLPGFVAATNYFFEKGQGL